METGEYIDGLTGHLLSLQDDLLEEEKSRNDICPSAGKETGRLLYILIRLIKPDQVLEIGTSVGYASIWMGLALRQTGGQLVTVEASERLAKEARQNIQRAGLDDVVEIINGQAQDVVAHLEGQFGMIFQDGGSRCYPETAELLAEKLEYGGLLVSDDVLFALHAERAKPREYMHEYNKKIFGQPELFSTLLETGNGLSLGIKIEDSGGNNSDKITGNNEY